MHIQGHFEDGQCSRLCAAELLVEGDRARVLGDDGRDLVPATSLSRIRVSSRLGSTPRTLRFPSGARFVTDDNDSVDLAFRKSHPLSGLLFGLESHLRLVAIALLVTVATVAAGIHWGVPALARHVAFALPTSVGEEAERLTMTTLDKQLLGPSRLTDAEQQRLRRAFDAVLDRYDSALGLRVLFRDGGTRIGANALALPAGTIIFTDQIVRVALHDEELVAVLAHEVGHVTERHALRGAIQASTLSLLVAFVLGDLSSVSSAVASIPILLTEFGYSRRFEHEADEHAVNTLAQLGIPPHRLADILHRLSPEDGGHGYLSTHPPTPERVQVITRGLQRDR